MTDVPVNRPFMFVGPTLTALRESKPATDVDLLLQDYQLLPPASCGSVDSLVAQYGDAGTMIVVDGYVDTRLAVGHAELCHALDRDWQVWGICDLGAIRAYELRAEGMTAYGEVGRYLENNGDFRDEEILWCFAPEAPYTVHNEPLLHMSMALRHLTDTTELGPDIAERIQTALASRWYKERDWAFFFRTVESRFPAFSDDMRTAMTSRKKEFQLKLFDFECFLDERPWAE